MSVQAVRTDQWIGTIPQSPTVSNWTINVGDIRTVKAGNVSLAASEKDIGDAFSFLGDIKYVEMQRETESTQQSFVTFKESQGADTAFLLSGSFIGGLPITITPVENYQLPPEAHSSSDEKYELNSAAVKKAEDVMSTMIAKGFIMGKDAINKAKALDERLHASATVASIDGSLGFSEKLSMGTALVNKKVRTMDDRFGIYEKTKSTFLVAGQTASTAGSALMSNHYFTKGVSWISSALGAFTKAASDVSMMTKVKVEKADVERNGIIYPGRSGYIDQF